MRLCIFIAITVFVLFSCTTKVKNDTIVEVDTPQDLEAEVKQELSQLLEEDSLIFFNINLTCYPYFKTLYKANELLWFTNASLNVKGDSLKTIINHCNYYGLYSPHYHLSKINRCLDSIKLLNNKFNITALVKADLLLSDAYFLMGAHVNKGRFYTDTLLYATNFDKLKPNWDSVLIKGYSNNSLNTALQNLEPKHYHYQNLKKQLQLIIQNPFLFNFDSVLVGNVVDEKTEQGIVRQLLAQGFYDTLSIANDSVKLAKALYKLQKQWFIQPDGKLGKYTIMALSYNRQKVINQIMASMERWRWEQEVFPEQYVFINIPAFELTVFESDTIVLQSAVVCGKPETQTPVLSSKIDHLLIYPYWKVPQSIATKEILPAVKRDTSYLRKKNFEVIGAKNKVLDYTTLPWKKYTEDYLPVTFRQRIGNENSLGIVKFNFNNPYGVYLHDTNSKKYFKTSNRSQSHGCIRVEKFEELANFLIRDDSLHYTRDSLLLYFSIQEQRKIKLKKRMPIYTRYYTACADSLGLKLYLDIYRKDEELLKLIYR